jgi:N-acetylglucosaminyldiphosphoundecaprenol N-acetyl-beta-D-mannosaminyltransferase
MNVPQPFGLSLSLDTARQIADAAIRGGVTESVALVVTPNIDHIATIRRSPAMARAYRNAARIVCDGWPVQVYARMRGLRVDRVTGCDITAELMRMVPRGGAHRLFFVVDSDLTKQAVLEWAARREIVCGVAVPPFGFACDADYCRRLAETIRDHGTTVLMMGVGAPHSEIFVDTHRTILPPCWAFCVGQAIKVELGLVRRASTRWRSVGMEWLWRLRQEPSRLARRYLTASIGFGFAVIEDQYRILRHSQP